MSTRALVTGTEKLFLVDLDSHDIQVVEAHRGEYYGITWPHDGRRLCLGHSGVDNAKLVTLEDYAHSERGWISIGDGESERFLSMPHQILCADEYLIATNTGGNSLAVIRMNDGFYRQYRPTVARWDRLSNQEAPGSHLNSIYRRTDRLYAVAHNHLRPSEVLVLAWPSMALLERIELEGPGAHNVWVDERDRICVCDTMRGQIIEARSRETLWRADHSDAMLRGAARRGQTLWVGDSAKAAREGRKHSDGAIFAVDCARWKLLDKIEIPAAGGVHEIRLIDEPDACHHGYPLLSPMRTDPEATARHTQLAAELRAKRERTHGWTLQQGSADLIDPRHVAAEEDILAVATRAAPLAENVRVDGRVTVPSHAVSRHMALVARYAGPGDENMVAALIFRVDARLRADIWRHAGGSWVMLAYTLLAPGGDSVDAALIAEGPVLTMLVNDRVVLQTADPHPQRGLTGVRGMAGKVENWSARELNT